MNRTALYLVLAYVRGWCPGCIGICLGTHAATHRAACPFRRQGDPW